MRMYYLSLMEVEDHIRIFHSVPVTQDGPGDLKYRHDKQVSFCEYSIAASPSLGVVEAPGAYANGLLAKQEYMSYLLQSHIERLATTGTRIHRHFGVLKSHDMLLDCGRQPENRERTQTQGERCKLLTEMPQAQEPMPQFLSWGEVFTTAPPFQGKKYIFPVSKPNWCFFLDFYHVWKVKCSMPPLREKHRYCLGGVVTTRKGVRSFCHSEKSLFPELSFTFFFLKSGANGGSQELTCFFLGTSLTDTHNWCKKLVKGILHNRGPFTLSNHLCYSSQF